MVRLGYVICDSVLHSQRQQHPLAVEGDPIRASGTKHDGARPRQLSREESVITLCDPRHDFCCVSAADVASCCVPRILVLTDGLRLPRHAVCGKILVGVHGVYLAVVL